MIRRPRESAYHNSLIKASRERRKLADMSGWTVRLRHSRKASERLLEASKGMYVVTVAYRRPWSRLRAAWALEALTEGVRRASFIEGDRGVYMFRVWGNPVQVRKGR